jgi:hypothetical protein
MTLLVTWIASQLSRVSYGIKEMFGFQKLTNMWLSGAFQKKVVFLHPELLIPFRVQDFITIKKTGQNIFLLPQPYSINMHPIHHYILG